MPVACFALLLVAAQTPAARWIQGWLPSYGDSNNAWLEGRAAYIHERDGFLYRGQRLAGHFGEGPRDGSSFASGNVHAPKGRAVYDPVHRIVFYGEGCCSWSDLVAAADVRPPRHRIVERDLRALQTLRGVRLGMSPMQVMSVYGRAKLLAVVGHPRVRMLAYTTWPPVASAIQGAGPLQCGQFQNFYFRHQRLVLIQLGNGC